MKAAFEILRKEKNSGIKQGLLPVWFSYTVTSEAHEDFVLYWAESEYLYIPLNSKSYSYINS